MFVRNIKTIELAQTRSANTSILIHDSERFADQQPLFDNPRINNIELQLLADPHANFVEIPIINQGQEHNFTVTKRKWGFKSLICLILVLLFFGPALFASVIDRENDDIDHKLEIYFDPTTICPDNSSFTSNPLIKGNMAKVNCYQAYTAAPIINQIPIDDNWPDKIGNFLSRGVHGTWEYSFGDNSIRIRKRIHYLIPLTILYDFEIWRDGKGLSKGEGFKTHEKAKEAAIKQANSIKACVIECLKLQESSKSL